MRHSGPLIRTTSLLAVGLLYLPMLAVAGFSINASRLGTHWKGFTLDWYLRLFHDPAVLSATVNTLLLAAISSLIGTAFGTALAIGIDSFPWAAPLRRLLDTVLYLPVVMPDIIFAAALLVVFRALRELTGYFTPGLMTMIIGHVTFQVAFVALVVRARIATLQKDLEEAARDLYATTGYMYRRVLLPLLTPAIVGGFLLAFTLSIDDFVISFFTSGPDSVTLPLYIYSSVKRGISPELHALAMVIFLGTLFLVVAAQWVVKDPRAAES